MEISMTFVTRLPVTRLPVTRLPVTRLLVTRLAALLIASIALCDSSTAQFRRTQNDSRPPSAILAERQIRERLNAGTVGLAGCLLDVAPSHFAPDIARVGKDSGAIHILPTGTPGPPLYVK